MKRALLLLSLLLPLSVLATNIDRQEVLKAIEQDIRDYYVVQDKIAEIIADLEQLERESAFSQVADEQALAELMSKRLRRFDEHFSVRWHDETRPPDAKPVRENWFSKLARKNAGFNRVEVLDGNVGYLDFWGFAELNQASRNKLAHAFGFLADTDALILDLRNNGGGSAETVQLIASYFFSEKTHLNSFYSRESGTTTEYWTLDGVKTLFPEPVPVYILTSAATFSAAEEFAYDFKHLKRATLVGEKTRGGANPWRSFELGGGFSAGIPVAMAINPVTKTNWEGTGVLPDIEVAGDMALDAAYRHALERIKASVTDPHQLKDIQEKIAALKGPRPAAGLRAD